VGLLVVGLAVGAALGYMTVPRSITTIQTKTQTSISTTTQTVVQTTTRVQVTTQGAGAILVANDGSGDARSQPFAATSANVEVKLNLTATASLNYVSVFWGIYQVGAYYATCSGGIDQQQGSLVDYCYGLTAGLNYFIEVNSPTGNWQVAVLELRT
jgi:hypothetical protein